MSCIRPLFLLVLGLSVVLLNVGCDDVDDPARVVVGPTPLRLLRPVNVQQANVQPAVIAAVPVANPLCPTRPPLSAFFDVVVEGDHHPGLVMSGLLMQFVDRQGTVGNTVRLDNTELLHRFGSTQVPAFGTRTFPLSFGFGCVGLPSGTLTVVTSVSDSHGFEGSTTRHISIR